MGTASISSSSEDFILALLNDFQHIYRLDCIHSFPFKDSVLFLKKNNTSFIGDSREERAVYVFVSVCRKICNTHQMLIHLIQYKLPYELSLSHAWGLP